MHGRRHWEFARIERFVLMLLLVGLLVAEWQVAAPLVSGHGLSAWSLAHADENPKDDAATFMIRNAYHFATLYHAAQAHRWELADYETDELVENLEEAERAAPTYAPMLKQYRQDYLRRLRQAIVSRDVRQFDRAFGDAVQGCNTCHVATRHPFIVIPSVPPQLSILVLTPSGGD